MAPLEILTASLVAAVPHPKKTPPLTRDRAEGHGRSRPAVFGDSSAHDAEYQQWRSEQLRQLELRYPEWHCNSYKDFVENFPHAGKPVTTALKSLRAEPMAGRRHAGGAVFGK